MTFEKVDDMPGWFPADQGRANKALQDILDKDKPRILASYALWGAILVLGGVGYAIDRWASTSPWFLLIGLVAGILIGFANLLASLRRR
jgi:F0F1-type ATP synthase assembly protein I